VGSCDLGSGGILGFRSDRDAVMLRDVPPVGSPMATRPAVAPNVHPECRNMPRINDDGFEELCHLVTEDDPDTALCGKDVAGYPWDPPWPRCEACLAVARGEMN
jgi:hypothetical protein